MLLIGAPATLRAQAASGGVPYTPATTEDRVQWILQDLASLRSLSVGVLAASWQTHIDIPTEWGRTWSGFGKRYLEREADIVFSDSLEAGLGSIWGEEPRYIRSGQRGVWPRARYAMKTVFLTQRRDGHLAPAWGRVIGNTVNNVIENTYLPASATTTEQTLYRTGSGFLGRLGGNMFSEFWPDLVRRLHRKQKSGVRSQKIATDRLPAVSCQPANDYKP